jgi:hypothetical protein
LLCLPVEDEIVEERRSVSAQAAKSRWDRRDRTPGGAFEADGHCEVI